MNQKFLEDVMNNEVTDDLLDETYHVNFDVTVDSGKFNVKVTAKNTENGQYILYGLNNVIAAVLREMSNRYDIPEKEILLLVSDSFHVLADKGLNNEDYIGLDFENE